MYIEHHIFDSMWKDWKQKCVSWLTGFHWSHLGKFSNIWTNVFKNVWQKYFLIFKNMFNNLDKYICKLHKYKGLEARNVLAGWQTSIGAIWGNGLAGRQRDEMSRRNSLKTKKMERLFIFSPAGISEKAAGQTARRQEKTQLWIWSHCVSDN